MGPWSPEVAPHIPCPRCPELPWLPHWWWSCHASAFLSTSLGTGSLSAGGSCTEPAGACSAEHTRRSLCLTAVLHGWLGETSSHAEKGSGAQGGIAPRGRRPRSPAEWCWTWGAVFHASSGRRFGGPEPVAACSSPPEAWPSEEGLLGLRRHGLWGRIKKNA
jgi:hypothetical protein